jgi:hypothetical protein
VKLRRGRVISVEETPRRVSVTRLSVELDRDGEQRAALAYPDLIGPVEAGDEVIVNVEARDLGLGSGGFDVVHANLSRGLEGDGEPGAHVMKLNYTPIQHAVRPIEEGLDAMPEALDLPVSVLALHGQLPAAAFAASQRLGGARVGYVQTAGGALPGVLSDVVAELRGRGAIQTHVTVAPCFGGDHEALTLEGALQAAVERLAWDAALVAPGPGIIGSASALGHGGLEALHSMHAAMSVGCAVTLAPRISSGDPRERHHGVSHHSVAVLELLLARIDVVVPSGIKADTRQQLEAACERGIGHRKVDVQVDDLIEPYRESGLPVETMGRSLEQDEDFFRSALAGGAVLATRVGERTR